MENITGKAEFLKNEYAKKLAALDPNTLPVWGKMSVQQMMEHMADYIRISNGRNPHEIVTAEEHLPKMVAFLESEKQMRENTPNPLLSDVPPAVKHTTVQDAIAAIQTEIDHLFEVFENDKELKTTHPFFGNLDFEHTIQLLHKHAMHHLRQFGLVV